MMPAEKKLSNKYFELHNHSMFSFLDGVGSPKDIVKRAKELGYEYCAITDHGEIASWFEFYSQCKANDISPILGCEFYMAHDINDTEESPFKKGEKMVKRNHLVVHAKGNDGVQAVRELYNNSWINYKEKGKQIIFEEDLIKCAGKVVVQSACITSYVDEEAKVVRFKEIFGDDFYLELQPHKIACDYDLHAQKWEDCDDKQLIHNRKLLEWSKKYDIKLVVTGDCHYCRKEDKVLQDIQILNSYIGRKTGWHFHQDSFYLMSKEEWWARFSELGMGDEFTPEDYENALKNNLEVAEKCKGAVLEKPASLRKYDLTTHDLYQQGDDADKLIARIIKDVGRFNKTQQYLDRLKYEMKVIKDKGFLDYFLIQEDIIRWNRKNGFLVGPARGSAAGCLLAYYMDITKVDPLKYDLLFERFLDISRNDFPDIDIDYEMKDETVAYITNKYGENFVMPVGAYQTIKVKTAIKNAYKILYDPNRDSSRVYDYQIVNDVTKMIPESNARGEGDQLDIFKEQLQLAKQEYDEYVKKEQKPPRNNLYLFMKDKPDLVNAVGKLLGKVTNMRVHPCSIVISDQPISNVLPITTVQSGTKSERWITAFDGGAVESSGYIKFDVLGLKTLNCISACLREIKKHKPSDPLGQIDPNDIWKLEPNDVGVLEKFAAGDTETVFQFNTDALRKMCMDVQVSNFNDLVAIVALVRPGPLKAGFPQLYMDRKFGKIGLHEMYEEKEIKGAKRKTVVPIKYSHPLMDEILKDTYNVITYQEQVQKMFVAIGGFTPIESNKIRKAISKGKRSLIVESKPQFMEYATTKLSPAWTEEQVDTFYEDMIGFGSYCFNLSHSASYALLGYVCQYLKTKYPLEWWSGNLEHAGEKGVEGILKIIKQDSLVPISGVNINKSKTDFHFDGKEIVMPLRYIDGVGDTGLPLIIKGQPYTSLADFVKRMPGRSVRKNAVVNLIVAGAFNEIETTRTPQQLIEYFYKELKKEKEIPTDDQMIIDDHSAFERRKGSIDPFYKSDWVSKFKAFFSGKITPLNELENYSENANVYIGGELTGVKYIAIKKGKNEGRQMAFLTLTQVNDTIKLTLWPDQVAAYKELLENPTGKIVEVQGKISRYNGDLGLQVNSMKEIRIS